MSANPHANGGKLRKPLTLPDFRDYAIAIDSPGTKEISPTETLGKFLRDVMRRNMTSFRVFSPDENASNRLQDIYEASLEDLDGGDQTGRCRRHRYSSGRPRNGDAQRAHAGGLAGGLCPDWPPWALQHL